MTMRFYFFLKKNPETRFIEQKLDSNEKLNALKHNQVDQQLNVLKSEDVHNEK